MPYPYQNLAASLVATAPSPATSGTSLVVTSGEGAIFADPATVGAYPVTLWPDGQLPTALNAEIALVTAKSGDTLTITRAQESTTARSVAVGWRVAASLTRAMMGATGHGYAVPPVGWYFSSPYVVGPTSDRPIGASFNGASYFPGYGGIVVVDKAIVRINTASATGSLTVTINPLSRDGIPDTGTTLATVTFSAATVGLVQSTISGTLTIPPNGIAVTPTGFGDGTGRVACGTSRGGGGPVSMSSTFASGAAWMQGVGGGPADTTNPLTVGFQRSA